MLIHTIDVPLQCVNTAAMEFHIPAKLIIAVLETERGRVGQISKNKNGTYDIGPMQVNSTWIPTLNKFGITEADLKNIPCVNLKAGAWILSKAIVHENNLLQGVGDYHSHTASLNQHYYQIIQIRYTALNQLLT